MDGLTSSVRLAIAITRILPFRLVMVMLAPLGVSIVAATLLHSLTVDIITDSILPNALLVIPLVLYVTTLYLIVYLYNGVVSLVILRRIRSEDGTVEAALQVTTARFGVIVLWAFKAVLGLVTVWGHVYYRARVQRAGLSRDEAFPFIVLLEEGCRPAEAKERSRQLVIQTWGEEAESNYSTAEAALLAVIGWIAGIVVLIVFLLQVDVQNEVTLGLVVGVASLAIVIVGISTLDSVHKLLQYNYAITGEIPSLFPKEVITRAWGLHPVDDARVTEDAQLATRRARVAAWLMDLPFSPAAILAAWYFANESWTIATVLALTGLLGTWFQVHSVASSGQTIGKAVLGIRIIDRRTRRPQEYAQSVVVRYGLTWLLNFIPPFIVVDALAMLRKDNQSLHDQLAGSLVVRVPSKEFSQDTSV